MPSTAERDAAGPAAGRAGERAARAEPGADALDRLAARLVRQASARPDGDGQAPIAVAELFHSLLPPRETAAELDLHSGEAYDRLLMRLLAGERGYLIGDPTMQRALAAALHAPTPDVGAWRRFAGAPVVLTRRALELLERVNACRCCGLRLPRGREPRFCPACGEDLSTRRCPACSTECERAWRFCIACGRQLEGAPEPGLAPMPAPPAPAAAALAPPIGR